MRGRDFDRLPHFEIDNAAATLSRFHFHIDDVTISTLRDVKFGAEVRSDRCEIVVRGEPLRSFVSPDIDRNLIERRSRFQAADPKDRALVEIRGTRVGFN